MLLSQIEGFLETARHRNLSRAADALHVTRPALTARIQMLESELGTALFVRGRHGMDLTDAGRAFLPYAERAMSALDAGASLLTELRRGGTGELVLGAAPAVSTASGSVIMMERPASSGVTRYTVYAASP